jgi:hypothetical protein
MNSASAQGERIMDSMSLEGCETRMEQKQKKDEQTRKAHVERLSPQPGPSATISHGC